MLVFEENTEKTSRCRVENQQTQPTHDTESRNRTRATLVGGECTHHCTIPAPRWVGLLRRYWLSFVSVWYTCACTLSFGQARGFKVCNVYHLNSMESFSIKCWSFNNNIVHLFGHYWLWTDQNPGKQGTLKCALWYTHLHSTFIVQDT